MSSAQSADIKDEQMYSEEEQSRRERISKTAEAEEKRQFMKRMRFFMGTMLTLSAGTFVWMGMPKDEADQLENESFLQGYYRRAKRGMNGWFESASEPVYGKKLLPDPLPAPYNRPFTLVVEMNDSLSHLVWDKDKGWRIATRPGLKQFLSYLSRYYEIVIFTKTPAHTAQPVADAIDPYQYAMYKLYRESTSLIKGKTIKDLSTLNRDLSKVICVDIDPESYSLQPENGLLLKAWKGEKGDKELAKMTTLLEEFALMMTIANMNDVRPLIKLVNNLNEQDPATGWQTHKDRMKQEFAADTLSKPLSWAARLGLSRAAPKSQFTNVFDYIEHIGREERKHHEVETKAAMESMAERRRQAEEEQRKQIEQMKAQKLKMWDYMFGSPQLAQPQAAATQ